MGYRSSRYPFFHDWMMIGSMIDQFIVVNFSVAFVVWSSIQWEIFRIRLIGGTYHRKSAYFLGLNFREYPHKTWPYMVRLRTSICSDPEDLPWIVWS